MSQTCMYCGHFNESDSATCCSGCGRPFGPVQRLPASNLRLDSFQDTFREIPPIQERHSVGLETLEAQTEGTLAGIVTVIKDGDERTPPNLYRSFSKALIILILSPPYIAAFILSFALFFMLAVLRCSTLAQFFNPLTWTSVLLGFFEILVLRRFRNPDQVRVYHGELRDDENRPWAFKMYGNLSAGSFIEGHRVLLRGEWRGRDAAPSARGTFMVTEGYDLETQSPITSTYRNPWRVLFWVLLFLLIAEILTGWLYLHPLLTH